MYKHLFLFILTWNILISGFSNNSAVYELPKPILTELDRLQETYTILDQFADSVWPGWDNYKTVPFLLTFQNGLKILVGHPEPPSEFVLYPGLKVNGLAIHIDTTHLNTYPVKYPLSAGGGPLYFGTFNKKPVKVVNINYTTLSPKAPALEHTGGEDNILVYIHELMHCYQPNIMKKQYGNLRINPDLNIALHSEIEGLALLKAFEQNSREKALPFLKDFCIARSYKIADLTEEEKKSYSCDEFREGEAVYSEYMILHQLKNGFKSSLQANEDSAYHHFANAGILLSRYPKRLLDVSKSTFDIYAKNYWYGCYEALLLERYFPGWQKEIENGLTFYDIFRKNLRVSGNDSIQAPQRFREIYGMDSLKEIHEKRIAGRDQNYQLFQQRKGFTYVIDMKPVLQFGTGLVNSKNKKYNLGLIWMYPEGIGEIRFDSISVSFKPVPTELNQLYYIKVIDTAPRKHKKPYKLKYKSKDDQGNYYGVTVETPLFTLNAPRICIREDKNRVKFLIQSRN